MCQLKTNFHLKFRTYPRNGKKDFFLEKHVFIVLWFVVVVCVSNWILVPQKYNNLRINGLSFRITIQKKSLLSCSFFFFLILGQHTWQTMTLTVVASRVDSGRKKCQKRDTLESFWRVWVFVYFSLHQLVMLLVIIRRRRRSIVM